MSFFFGDGFDLYAAPIDMVAGHWDATSLNPNSSALVAGRFSGSRAVNFSSSTTLIKASNVNDAVHHFTVAFVNSNVTGSTSGAYIGLWDGATAQCSVVFKTDGSIVLTSGVATGTVIATYAGAAPTSSVWYVFEIEIVIHNTAGSIAIRKNGNVTNDFFLGSLNTRATSNSYANKIQLGSAGAGTHSFDDFLWRSDASVVPWVGDVRCYTRMPLSDASVQFSRSTTPVSVQVYSQTGIVNSVPANNALYFQIVPAYSGLVTGVSISCTGGGGGTGHVKMAMFSSVGNAVGSVMATTSEVTNPGNAIISFTFPTPAHVTVGQSYWFGINQDASIGYNMLNSSSAAVNAISITGSTYASWPVSNPGGTISTFNIPGTLTLTYTPSFNSDCVSEKLQDAGVTYVYSSTNGQADLYNVASIPSTPVSILGITTRGFFQKNDAGTRNAAVQLKSGATVVQSPSTPLNMVWSSLERTDLVDPATGAAWTAAAVNSINIGPVVTA